MINIINKVKFIALKDNYGNITVIEMEVSSEEDIKKIEEREDFVQWA